MPREHLAQGYQVERGFVLEPFLLLLFPASLLPTEQVSFPLAPLFGQSQPTGTRKRKGSVPAVCASISPLLSPAPQAAGVL